MTVERIAVIGGGIVGAAVARRLQQRVPNCQVLLFEKEESLAAHQTGRNSGVIHAGIYYKPGSIKAKFCVLGNRLTYEYCEEKKIPFHKCGKLIVATNEEEVPGLKALMENAKANDVRDVQYLDATQGQVIEPHCRMKAAILSPHTGIVDWAQVTRSYASDLVEAGGRVFLGHELTGFSSPGVGNTQMAALQDSLSVTRYRSGVQLHFANCEPVVVDRVVTCGGLHADRLAEMSGSAPADIPRVLPVRGEYLVLKQEKRHLVRGNIYPVPYPGLPFLGVHFTPRMDGSLWLGPNAVLALARQGYSWTAWKMEDIWALLSYSGFYRFSLRHVGFGLEETYRSLFTAAQVSRLQQYIPEITVDDVMPGPAGVRAQMLSPDGGLIDDFTYDWGPAGSARRFLHVLNTPSPGATSSLAIAAAVAEKSIAHFGLGEIRKAVTLR
eukprot:m.93435 g.93435  ORF g.93435 m.93435 type:complete len:439 (+) comp13810_c0_seq1:64-1380(+)